MHADVFKVWLKLCCRVAVLYFAFGRFKAAGLKLFERLIEMIIWKCCMYKIIFNNDIVIYWYNRADFFFRIIYCHGRALQIKPGAFDMLTSLLQLWVYMRWTNIHVDLLLKTMAYLRASWLHAVVCIWKFCEIKRGKCVCHSVSLMRICITEKCLYRRGLSLLNGGWLERKRCVQ